MGCLWIGAAAAQSDLGSLVFVRAGNLWARDLPGGIARQLTADGHSDSPKWSSSGAWIAFLRDGQPWVVRADGSNPAHLSADVDNRADLEWSPTGDVLAAGSAGVFQRDAGGAWRQISPGGEHPVWSPDGQHLVMDGLSILDISTGRRGPGLVPNAPGPTIPAAWSGDGRQILYWAAPEVSASLLADGLRLHSVPAAGGPNRDTGAWALIDSDFVALAPGGQRVALANGCCRESWQEKWIAIFDFPTGQVRRLTGPEEAAISPAWSPAGNTIAFVSSHDFGPEEAARPHRAIAPNGAAVTVPAGRRVGVSFEQQQATLGTRRIWVMDNQGAARRQLTHDDRYRDERPLWSADGAHILFARVDPAGGISLWIMRNDGSELAEVADSLSVPPQAFQSPRREYYGHIRWESFFDWRR
ncbi:MAG TPA: hypothetical protein VJ732_17400 [Bryobacteraceae bacterium]|nr:hypothetical protein [Bryobacteraceae bacterium]